VQLFPSYYFRIIILKCGAEGEWRRPVGLIMSEMKNCYRVEKERNILHRIERRKANWIGHILCRNCPLMHVIEGKIE
jgi:hypothetical protein